MTNKKVLYRYLKALATKIRKKCPQFLIVQKSETTSGGILLLCSEPRLRKCSSYCAYEMEEAKPKLV